MCRRLVLAFHGGGGHAEYMADDAHYGLVAKAEREGFVAAFPNGYSRFPRGRLATWNAGGCCGEARDRAVDDVGFVRAVVAHVKSRVAIDGARVFAVGMSNGGMLAHRLACEAPDVFRAVASVAGTDATANCAPSRPTSVLHIHARNDTHLLFTGGAGEDAFRDASKVMDFVSVPETVARWVKRNQCSPAPRRILEKPGAYCDAYSGCAGGVSVQLCVTEQGGHSWPGAKTVRRGKETASRAINANDTIWDFFGRSGSADPQD
jgi:polyhydroxybutyrate depolymerase